MDHPAHHILTQLATQPIDAADQAMLQAQEHVASCEHCQQQVQSLRQTWELLGNWQVDATSHDITARVLDAAAPQPAPLQPALRFRPWGTLRMAASITLALTAGIAAAWIAHQPVQQQTNRTMAAERSLLLPQFQNGSPGMFSQSILGFDPDSRKVSQP